MLRTVVRIYYAPKTVRDGAIVRDDGKLTIGLPARNTDRSPPYNAQV